MEQAVFTKQLSPEMQECITNCTDCHAICVQAISHCLEQGESHAESGHIRLLINCAEICQTSANFMLSGSPFHARTCEVCAEVCEDCATSCEKFGNDEIMRQCAEICRRCVDSCRRMSGHDQARAA